MSEVLTQAQIDALLNSMAGGGGDAEETAVEKKEEIKSRERVRKDIKEKLENI